jgi:hypothetical protein
MLDQQLGQRDFVDLNRERDPAGRYDGASGPYGRRWCCPWLLRILRAGSGVYIIHTTFVIIPLSHWLGRAAASGLIELAPQRLRTRPAVGTGTAGRPGARPIVRIERRDLPRLQADEPIELGPGLLVATAAAPTPRRQ